MSHKFPTKAADAGTIAKIAETFKAMFPGAGAKCSHCGEACGADRNGLAIVHSHPKPTRMVCKGAGKPTVAP